MGTYININGDFVIKKSNIPHAVQALKDLNQKHELKRGGTFKGEKWYAWMDPDYDKKMDSIEEILGESGLGFTIIKSDFDSQKVMYHVAYNDKWGQHEVFFIAMCPYLESLELNHFCDELDYEDQQWKIVLGEDKKPHFLEPRVTIEWPDTSVSNITNVEAFAPPNYDYLYAKSE
jgi:hypothetical protein